MHEEDTLLSKTDLDEIRQLEESLWIAATRFDAALMNKLFARDFFEFGRSGKMYKRAEMLIEPRPGQTIKATIPLLNFHARQLSPEIVQVTYVSEVVYGDDVERANRSSICSLMLPTLYDCANRWDNFRKMTRLGAIQPKPDNLQAAILPHSCDKHRNEAVLK